MSTWRYELVGEGSHPEICGCGETIHPLELVAQERDGASSRTRCLKCAVSKQAPSVPLVIVAQSYRLLHAYFARALAALALKKSAPTPVPVIRPAESNAPVTSPGTPSAKHARFLELGEAAYEGYGGFTAFRTFDNRPMPTWADLPERVKSAWAAAAQAMVEQQEA